MLLWGGWACCVKKRTFKQISKRTQGLDIKLSRVRRRALQKWLNVTLNIPRGRNDAAGVFISLSVYFLIMQDLWCFFFCPVSSSHSPSEMGGGMEGWRDGGRGGRRPNSQSDGWRKGRAEGWCRKTREAPEGNCREEKRWKEKPREAPLQLRRIPSSLHCSSCNLITNCCQTSHSMYQLSYMCNNPEPGITVRLWAVLHQEHKPWIKIRRLTFW